MKISLTPSMKLLSTGLIAFSIALLTSQAPVQAYTVKLAQAETNAQMTKLTDELTRRSNELSKSSIALNGQIQIGAGGGSTTTTTTSGTAGKDSKECANGDKNTERAITKVNKDSSDASKSIQDMLTQAKQSNASATAKQQSTKADAQYNDYKVANAQNNVMNAVCTQKDAQAKLETLIKQAQDKQAQSESSGDSSSSSGGGGGGLDIKSMIQKVIQLVAAVSAIIASIVALVQAIQKGDFAAATAILATVVGQLAAAANILLDGEGEITDIINSLDTITN